MAGVPIDLRFHQKFSDLDLKNAIVHFFWEVFGVVFEEKIARYDLIDE
jgi:hypothetical protein